eukprot:5636475-Lingulodinium_polyedra.AAC.1
MSLQVSATAPGLLQGRKSGVARPMPGSLVAEAPPLCPRGRGFCVLMSELTLADSESPPDRARGQATVTPGRREAPLGEDHQKTTR